MKIVVCLRTLNERPHLARFLWGYDWVDKILVADGGSTDGTQEFLSSHPLVELCDYTVTVTHPESGVVRNPEGKHVNFLLDWAYQEGADWTILDDADSCPNFLLKRNARELFETCRMDSIWAFRMYLWGTDKWFPRLTGSSLDPEDKWAGIWGWRTGLNYWLEDDPFNIETEGLLEGSTRQTVYYPNTLLHYFCLTPEIAQRKQEFYNAILTGGLLPQLESCGPLRRTPPWAIP